MLCSVGNWRLTVACSFSFTFPLFAGLSVFATGSGGMGDLVPESSVAWESGLGLELGLELGLGLGALLSGSTLVILLSVVGTWVSGFGRVVVSGPCALRSLGCSFMVLRKRSRCSGSAGALRLRQGGGLLAAQTMGGMVVVGLGVRDASCILFDFVNRLRCVIV